MRKNMKKVIGMLLVALMTAACTNTSYERPAKVVFVGVDGWSAASFEKGDFPFVKGLMEQSSWTLDKRCVFPTASAINWMSLLSGVSPEYHGYIRWDSRRQEITPAWTDERGEVPTLFHLNRGAHPDCKMLVTYQWDVIRSLVDTTAVNACVPFPQTEEGDWEEARWAADYIAKEQPHFSFVYFSSLDSVGHKCGWESEEYLTYASHIDSVIRSFVEAVQDDNTVFVLTSDHGGHGQHHSTEYVDETLQTPLFIWGKGIKKGYQVEAPTIEMDVTATLAKLLGVEPLSHWTCRPLDEIFE